MLQDSELHCKLFYTPFNMSNPWPIGIHLIKYTVQQTMTQAERLLCAEREPRVAYEHIFKILPSRCNSEPENTRCV